MPLSVRQAVLALVVSLTPGAALAQPSSPVPSRSGRAAIRSPADARAGALLPGFETMADGSSRLFVELSKPVTYETKSARRSITYVLKGARVLKRNNTNPLVTVHFNTPVKVARLVPHGHDLWFVIELRASVQPTVSMDPAKDGTAVMRIELPKGDYLPASVGGPHAAGAAGEAQTAAPETSSASSSTSASTSASPR